MSQPPEDPYPGASGADAPIPPPVNPYGVPGQQTPQPGWGPPPGQPPYGYPYGQMMAPEHPRATTTLVLGVLSLVLCQILAPFAWVMGNKVVKEIDASGGQIGGRSTANAGRICGIVGTIILGLGVLALVLLVVLAVASIGTLNGVSSNS